MSGSKVLIVEDEVIVAMSIERSLSSFGYDVVGLSTTPEDAIRMAEELNPDLVLMDINLDGEIDGIDAAEKIAEFSDIPVVYLTSYTNEETLRRAISTNPYGYLAKPIRPREIYITIETVLNKHRANLAEEKLKENKRAQWEILNSIDVGYCLTECDPADGKCKITAINDKACRFLNVSGRNIWNRGAEIDEFLPGLSKSAIKGIREGKKRFVVEISNPSGPSSSEKLRLMLRVTNSEGKYTIFISFIEPNENSDVNGTPASGARSLKTNGSEYGGIENIREHVSSILNLCGESSGGECVDEISSHAKEIEVLLERL